MECRYGPDGKVQETPVGAPAKTEAVPKGPMGKIVEKKMAEMQEYMNRLKSLISHYAPPDPQKIQASMQTGNANLNLARDSATLTIQNYYKAGDQVVFAFDMATKRLTSSNVNTYLDDPKKDVVTMTNQFASLPDGANYVQQTVVNATAEQIQIKTTNSGYSLVAQPAAERLYRSF